MDGKDDKEKKEETTTESKETPESPQEEKKDDVTKENEQVEPPEKKNEGKEDKEVEDDEDEAPAESKDGKKDKSLEARLERLEKREREASIKNACADAGMDPKYVKLVAGQVEYTEDNEIKNPKKMFKKLRETYPEFFKKESGKKEVPNTDNTTTANDKGKRVFTRDEIKKLSAVEYQKYRDEIFKQEKAGLIK